jgi:diguanylate cyclase (GGDEF)-like protein
MRHIIIDSVVSRPLMFWVLAGLAIVIDLRPLATAGATRRFATIFVSICFSFAIFLVWGPGWAIAVQSLATVSAAVRHRFGVERTLVLVVQYALSFVAAEIALRALGEPSFVLGQRMTGYDGFCLAVAAAVWFTVNNTIWLVRLRLREVGSWRQALTPTLGYELLSTGALLLLAPLFVGAPTGWAVGLVLVPVLAVSQLAWLYNKQSEELQRDSLTGLLSRRAITQEIDDLTAWQGSKRNPESPDRFALTLLDLDRFREVNDALGHAVGDRILAVVAERLTESARSTDLLARLGGDEFAILQRHVPDAPAARALGAHLARSLAAPADVDGQPIDIAASTGIALYPDHGLDATTLMRHAEAAMYEAKHRNDATMVYAPGAEQTSATRLSLLADLRLALEDLAHRDEIAFFYQPQVALKTGDVVAAEALLRWHHPDRGVVNLEDILQVAERSPVMRQLTLRVVDDVLAQVAQWNAAGLTLRAAINVSARDLDTPDLGNHIAAALEWREVRAAQLTVELTETSLMAEIGPVQANLRRLADLGVEIALDDFGTGYSSLAHVRRLAVTEIKIDRSFTSRMATDHGDNAIVRSIIGLARNLGLRVVAEGVEDEDTYDLLTEAGCDIAQGWLIARPMPAVRFLEWLGERRGRSHESGHRECTA